MVHGNIETLLSPPKTTVPLHPYCPSWACRPCSCPLWCILQLTSSHAGLSERHVPTRARPLSSFQSRPSFFPLHWPCGRKQVLLLDLFFSSLSFHAKKDSPIFAGILPSQRTSPTNVSRSTTQGLCIHARWGKHPTLLDRRSRGGRGERVKKQNGQRFTSTLSCQNKKCKAAFWHVSRNFGDTTRF